VNATRDAGQRNIPVKVGWRSNRYRVDIALKQFVDIGDCDAAQCPRDEVRLLAVGIRDTDQFGSRQPRKYARVIAAHDADTDDTDTQRTLRARYCSLHILMVSPRPKLSAAHPPLARHHGAGDSPQEWMANTF
jgi:hypothetical protein